MNYTYNFMLNTGGSTTCNTFWNSLKNSVSFLLDKEYVYNDLIRFLW